MCPVHNMSNVAGAINHTSIHFILDYQIESVVFVTPEGAS